MSFESNKVDSGQQGSGQINQGGALSLTNQINDTDVHQEAETEGGMA